MWYILGFKSNNPIYLPGNSKLSYSISRINQDIVEVYLFDLELSDRQLSRIELQIKNASNVSIFFPVARHLTTVTNFVEKLKRCNLVPVDITDTVRQDFFSKLSCLEIPYVESEFALQAYILKGVNQMETTITGLWRLGFLQRPLMHLWLMSNDADSKDPIDELCHRTGYHKEVVKFLIDVFDQAGVLSIIEKKLIFDQQAKDTIEEYIKNDYSYDRKVKNIRLSLAESSHDDRENIVLVTAKEFLDISYGKNKKDFALYVRGIFKAYMPNVYISEIASDANSIRFTISTPGIWTADFYCYPGNRTVTKSDLAITLLDANLKSINVISGHHFNADVVKGAKGRVVHLIDPFSMLRWHKFLASLSENELIAYTEHFPDTFDKKGGYVSIGLATNTLRAIIKNK